MSKLVGVVEKPQFDIEIFKPGKAVHVKEFDKFCGYKFKEMEGLIGKSNPIELTVWFYEENSGHCVCRTIPIDLVISRSVRINLLRKEN